MRKVELYPPNGGMPVIPHPTKVDEYLAKGWTTEPPKKAKLKRKPKGEE